jgi:UDP-2-acetamido-3-amino-2,3-dideoxy-glucuronate N-acetyltransferase
MDYFCHETAVVDDGAAIGRGSRIWHFVHVGSGARIGEDVTLGQNVFVASGAVVGNGCRVQNNVSIYDGVVLEEEVFCGPSMVFTNVVNPRAAVERKSEFRQTRVGRGASLGANCTIVCGASIGAYAFVGAGAVVTRDVKDHALVVGVPAEQVGWMSRHGERLDLPLDGDGSAQCPATGERYVLESGICWIAA